MQITNDVQQFLTHILAGIVTIFEDPDLEKTQLVIYNM